MMERLLDPAWAETVLWIFGCVVIGYFILLNGIYLVTSLFAFGALSRYARRLRVIHMEELLMTAGAPPITLLAPGYNEEATCVESMRSMLSLEYPAYEVIFINDGSKDGTLDRLAAEFELVPSDRMPVSEIPTAAIRGVYRSRLRKNFWVIDKENGGKADTLNTGINFCRTPLFCAMDADTLLERQALLRIVRPFLEDSRTVAAGGIIRIANDCTVKSGAVTDVRLPRSWIASFQVMEYLRAFLSGRMGWDALNSTLIISGAFGLFRREIVVAAGGYATKRTSGETVGEDMELVVRLHRHCRENGIPYRIGFVPDPVAWTECPESLKVLGRQRDRWQRGVIETLSRHRVMLFNPRYGRAGMIAFPYFYFLEMLGPIIEFCGYIVFALQLANGWYSTGYVIAFLAVAFVLGMCLSVASVGLEELCFRRYTRATDVLKLFGIAILENLGYRQLNTWWRFRGTISSLRGVQGWGKMERKGFGRK
jgi:cellulose synthase/poly-beta-1,6-N-acetylglucosamine synthase-like glycosyltransferase